MDSKKETYTFEDLWTGQTEEEKDKNMEVLADIVLRAYLNKDVRESILKGIELKNQEKNE